MKSQNIFIILIKFLLGIAILAGLFLIGPLLIIWALNTLFPIVGIPYTWQTWAAAFVLSAPFTGNALFRRKKNDA